MKAHLFGASALVALTTICGSGGRSYAEDASHADELALCENTPGETLAPAGVCENTPGKSSAGQLWIGGGTSVLGSLGSLGLSVGPRFTMHYNLPYGFDVGGSLISTIFAHEVAAKAIQFLILGEASYTFGDRDWVVSPHINAGLGAHIYTATEPISRSRFTVPGLQQGLAFAAVPGAGLDFALTPSIHLDLNLAAVIVGPEPEINAGRGRRERAREPMLLANLDLIFAP